MEFNEFLKNFADQFDGIDLAEINKDTVYQELEEWSSLTALNLMAMAKTQYGKSISGREVRHCKTIEDLYNLIVSK